MANKQQLSNDFSVLENVKLDVYPELIAIGFNKEGKIATKVFVHKTNEQLQISISHLYIDIFQEEQ